ncbi:MAG: mobilization protein [Pedobacter sp.]|nr:MAG: mobilization protein [Pedobacter sp.]
MGRKKITQEDLLLIKPIRTRVTTVVFERLEAVRKTSDCKSIGELCRRILSQEPITVFQRDASLDGPTEQLLLIYRELKFMGHNINQITRSFHESELSHRKIYHALRICQRNPHCLHEAGLNILPEHLKKTWDLFEHRIYSLAVANFELAWLRAAQFSDSQLNYTQFDDH